MAVTPDIAPFINTTFYVTGEFGTVRPTHVHVGVDLATPNNDNLYSVLDGEVIYKDSSSVRGYYIVVRGDNGYAFLYQHLKEPSNKNVGDRVQIGELVGIEGSSGESTGIHLHMEMQQIGSGNWKFSSNINDYINPCEYMNIPNVTGTECFYNGTPIIKTKNWKKWLFAKTKKITIKVR